MEKNNNKLRLTLGIGLVTNALLSACGSTTTATPFELKPTKPPVLIPTFTVSPYPTEPSTATLPPDTETPTIPPTEEPTNTPPDTPTSTPTETPSPTETNTLVPPSPSVTKIATARPTPHELTPQEIASVIKSSNGYNSDQGIYQFDSYITTGQTIVTIGGSTGFSPNTAREIITWINDLSRVQKLQPYVNQIRFIVNVPPQLRDSLASGYQRFTDPQGYYIYGILIKEDMLNNPQMYGNIDHPKNSARGLFYGAWSHENVGRIGSWLQPNGSPANKSV